MHLNHAVFVKLYHPYTQCPVNLHLSHRRIATFSAHRDFLGEHYYYGMSRPSVRRSVVCPSVCRLSVVCDVVAQTVELSGHIFAPSRNLDSLY